MVYIFKLLRHRNYIFIFIIILIGFYLRVWNFQNLFYFAIDEEKAGFIISQITYGIHFPTVGHPSSIGFRLGPLIYYLIAPFYKIFGPYPYIWGFVSVAASIISMALIYKIGTKMAKHTGIYALILYAFSYLNILYDRRGWQVSFHSVIALLVLISLFKLIKGKKYFSFLLTGALIAATQFEVATILFLPLVLLSFVLFKIKLQKKLLVTCIAIFLLSQVGLLIFDLRHNFLNSKYLINYFRPTTKERIATNVPLTGLREAYLAHNLIPSTFARTLFSASTTNIAIQYANCPQYLSFKQNSIPLILKWMIIIFFLIFGLHVLKHWKDKSDTYLILKIITIYMVLTFTGIIIYTYIFDGEMAEYYLLSSFAYFFIILVFFLDKILNNKSKLLVFIFLSVFSVFNIYQLLISSNPYGYSHKIEAIKYTISIVQDRPFVLDSFQTCWYSGGYRYLFNLAGHQPTKSYMDQYLSEYYISDLLTKPEYQVVILTPELIGDNSEHYIEYRDKISSIANYRGQFGAIEIYIKRISDEK